MGNSALLYNTTGINNTAVGFRASCCNTTGAGNAAFGVNALFVSTTGCQNTALGVNALCANTTGYCNTATGHSSLQGNTTGYRNTATGRFALCKVTTGKSNIGIGVLAGCNITTTKITIAVGTDASSDDTDNHTVWGNASNNVCNCVYVDWTNVSDCRDKTNIQSLPDNLGLRFINKLRPVKFNSDHRETYVTKCGYEYGQKDGTLAGSKEHYGFVAQEIRETLNELNVSFDALGHDNQKDAYRLTYEELIAPIIKAIQELKAEIDALKAQ
jgi:hypothetical protein